MDENHKASAHIIGLGNCASTHVAGIKSWRLPWPWRTA